MTELWPAGQLITVSVDSNGIPTQFVWQERTHRIREIVQWWQTDTEWWHTAGRVWRDYVVVMTTNDLFCVICYDQLGEEWRLLRFYD